MRNQKGITLLLLVATVLIMIIILGTITYTSMDSFKMDQYYKMCADIELLDGKVALYYLNHKDDVGDTNGGLPIDKSQEASDDIKKAATTSGNVNYNPNNNNKFYKIDLSKLENLTLNHNGDFYINEKSHTIYYSIGYELDDYELDDNVYYTIKKDYQKSDADSIKESYSYIKIGYEV